MLKKIILNSGVQIVGRAISLVISITIAGILTHRLGTHGYGNYVFISSYATLLVTIANWGTSIIGVRELSKVKNKKSLYINLIILRLAFTIFTIFAGGTAIIFLPTFEGLRETTFIVLPLILVSILESTFYIIYQTLVRMELKSLFQTLSQILFLGLTIFFLNANLKIAAPLIGYLVGKLISSLISWPVSLSLLKSKNSLLRLQPEKIKKLFWASFPLGLQLILFTSYDQAVDSFIIKNYLGAGQVGIYGLAYKIYSNLVLPAYYLNSTILPMVSKNNSKSRKSIKTAFLLTLLGLIFLVPGTIFISGPAVKLIAGSNFGQSGQILKILAVSLIFSYFNHLTGFLLIAKNKQVGSLVIALIALFWNLIMNFFFVPKFGISAAAWVTVSTEALVSIISTWYLVKCYNNQK